MSEPVFGLVTELPDGVELPASIADNKTGDELYLLIDRFATMPRDPSVRGGSEEGWDYTHLSIPDPGKEINQLMASGTVVDGQLRIKVCHAPALHRHQFSWWFR